MAETFFHQELQRQKILHVVVTLESFLHRTLRTKFFAISRATFSGSSEASRLCSATSSGFIHVSGSEHFTFTTKAMSHGSLKAETLVENFVQICSVIQQHLTFIGCVTIAEKLYEKGIITESEYENVEQPYNTATMAASKLMEAFCTKLTPENVQLFHDILRDDLHQKDLANWICEPAQSQEVHLSVENFKKHYFVVKRRLSLDCCTEIAGKLAGKKILSTDEYLEVVQPFNTTTAAASKLMAYLRKKITPEYVRIFIEILRESPYRPDLVKILTATENDLSLSD